MGTTEPEDAPPPRLEYDRDAAPYATRRSVRVLTALTLLNTVLLAGGVVAPRVTPFVQSQWRQWKSDRAAKRYAQQQVVRQRQCLTHLLPADAVVYEEDPAAALALQGKGGQYVSALPSRSGGDPPPPGFQPPVRTPVPDYYPHFLLTMQSGLGYETEFPVLFLHERATPGGQRRLVAVRLQPAFTFKREARLRAGGGTGAGSDHVFFVDKFRRLLARSWPVEPPDNRPSPSEEQYLKLRLPDAGWEVARIPDLAAAQQAEKLAIDYGHTLRFYAGQPDPNDKTRFTIAYAVDGRPGTIDGRVKSDGTVELRPREGGGTYDDRQPVWDLLANAPKTAPATGPAPRPLR